MTAYVIFEKDERGKVDAYAYNSPQEVIKEVMFAQSAGSVVYRIIKLTDNAKAELMTIEFKDGQFELVPATGGAKK